MTNKAQDKSNFMTGTGTDQGPTSAFVKETPNKTGGALPKSVFLGPGVDSGPALNSVKVPVTKPTSDFESVKQGQVVETQQQQPKAADNQSSAENPAAELIRQLTDMNPIPSDESLYEQFQNLYLWVTACVLAFTVANHLSMRILGDVLAHGSLLVMAIVILVPLVSVRVLPLNDMDVQTRRSLLLIMTLIDGIVSGMALSKRDSTISAPLPFIVPLSLGLCIRFLGPNFADRPRPTLLAITLAPAFVFYVVYGVFEKSLVVGYNSWMASLILKGAIDFQLKLAKIREKNDNVFFSELQSILTFVICHIFYAFLTSSPESDKPEASGAAEDSEDQRWFWS